jgi:hypothetical protein
MRDENRGLEKLSNIGQHGFSEKPMLTHNRKFLDKAVKYYATRRN